jgi:hypothetical protein
MAAVRHTQAGNRVSVSEGNPPASGAGRPSFSGKKVIILGSAAALLLIFCAYRILTFVPQAFDSPQTLRPGLYDFFHGFVEGYPNPEQAHQAWGTYCIAALLIPTILAFWNYFYTRSGSRALTRLNTVLSSRALLFTGIALCLLVCRFPALLGGEMNPDETFFIAAAQKLFIDPVFFRAVDFVTSGPLNVYPLMLPAVFGISPDYASTRLVALVMIFASIYVMYRAVALLTDDATARIAILPAAGAFAVLKYGDFVDFTSEHLSFLWLSLAFYGCVKTFRRPQAYTWNIFGIGLLTGAAFLAKMQAVPILLCVAAIAIAYVHGGGHARRWWRPALLFVAGLVPVLLVNAIVCLWAGVWHDFWMEYIVGNFYNVRPHPAMTAEMQRFADFALGVTDIRLMVTCLLAILAAYVFQKNRREPVDDHVLFLQTALVGGIVAVAASWLLSTVGSAALSYAAMVLILILVGTFFLLYREPDWNPDPVRWYGLLVAVVLAAGAAVAYAPHRSFGHYLLLLVLPLTMAMSWFAVAASSARVEPLVGNNDGGLTRARHSRVPFLLVFVVLTLACQLYQLGSPDNIAFADAPKTVRAPESSLIEALTPPDGKITVWGWYGAPYVSAGRVSAIKDLITDQLFFDNNREVRAYYREAYLRGLRRARPELFIDSIGNPRAFDQKNHFEGIPAINSFIQSNYVHVLDAYNDRFYIRSDLAQSVAGIGESRKCDAQALRCFEASAASRMPADLPPIEMPEHALIEATFTPEIRQDLYTDVFSNHSDAGAHDGFQFQHLPTDRYRLVIGWGPDWAVSEPILLPRKKPVYLRIEFNGDVVKIVCNGVGHEEMRLPKRMLDSRGPITVGSWIDHQRPFVGNIQFFQIRDLGKGR